MGAMTLVVDRRGSSVGLDRKGVVVIHYPDGEAHRVGVQALGQLVVVGEVALSAGLLRRCHAAGVAVSLLPGRGRGEALGIAGVGGGRMRRRLAQYRLHFDPAGRQELAAALVVGKIRRQAAVLALHGVDAGLERFSQEAGQVTSIAALMGVEGAAAARYFACWGRLWEAPWGFQGRNRRPPRDPVNALLSLGYTLAGQYVARHLARFGLDPTVGFLHEAMSGRDALMLDLLEWLRPLVDQRVWSLAADGLLLPSQFHCDSQYGCRLNKDARSVFFAEWFPDEDHWFLTPLRQAIALLLWRLRSPDSEGRSPALG